MKFATCAALALMPLSAAAMDEMTQASCQQGFKRAVTLGQAETPDLLEVVRSVTATEDGWCRLAAEDADEEFFAEVFWRMEDGARWTRDGIPPLALEVRVTGIVPDPTPLSPYTAQPLLDLEMVFRQNPDAGIVLLERATLDNGAGDVMVLSGVFERVFLSSPSMMQVSMGSATFKAGLMQLTFASDNENPFGFNWKVELDGTPEAQFAGVFDTISALPEGVIDDASRAELTAYATALPRPLGTLEVALSSQRGLGLMQVGMSMYSAFNTSRVGDRVTDSAELDILLDGITITADWAPAETPAD